MRQGIASIAKMTSLTALTLCDCNAITGNGLGAMSALTRLEALSVVRCNQVIRGMQCMQTASKPAVASAKRFAFMHSSGALQPEAT